MNMRRDGDVLVLALFVGCFPLVPAVSTLVGMSVPLAFDVTVVAFVVAYSLARWVRGAPLGATAVDADARVVRSLLVYFVAVCGAGLVGAVAENRFGSSVLAAHVGSLFGPQERWVDLTTDPFYPLRVWLTAVEGVVVFAVAWQWCARAADPFRHAMVAAGGWIVGSVVVSLLAIAQYLTRYQLHPLWVARNPFLVRANATLDDPNMLGSYLVLGIGIALAVALATRRRLTAQLATFACGLACVALVTTVSRAAFAGLALALLLVGSFVPITAWQRLDGLAPRLRTLSRAILSATVLVVTVVVSLRATVEPRATDLPKTPLDAVVQTIDPRVPLDNVLKGRTVYWGAAWRAFMEHPATGIGLGRYPRTLPEHQSRWVPIENAHNFYLQLLAEGGLLTLCAFVALLMTSVAIVARAARGLFPVAGFAAGSLVAIVGFAFTLFSGQPLINQSGQVLWGAALGVALAGAGVSADHSRPPGQHGFLMLVLIAGVAALFVAAAVNMPSPPLAATPWGYSWGLFPEEQGYFPEDVRLPREDKGARSGPPGTQVTRFRWTGPEALVELRVPSAASECVVPFAALLPSYKTHQAVLFSYGDTTQALDVGTSDVIFLRASLSPHVVGPDRRLVMRLQVSPTLVPAELGLSADRRRLGVQVFPITCR